VIVAPSAREAVDNANDTNDPADGDVMM